MIYAVAFAVMTILDPPNVREALICIVIAIPFLFLGITK